ncbi:MAG: hypothetical protein E4H16_03555 [Candidatus Atribacteria bacterium]|nr:MAG: hypothetical protein E4H16_03555 [Candidatus Atribacteria bacterium]
MFLLIKTWQESGISQKEFCSQHDLSAHAFYYWLRKYKQASQPSENGFIPVEIGSPVISPVNDTRGDIRIHYPNGVLVTLDRAVSISRIRALIKAV